MGCSSSSMAQYPGNRVPAQAPHQPAASEFNKDGQAMSHFVSYGGGNALILQEGGPQVGAVPVGNTKPSPEYVQVTLPPGVEPGQKIRVQSPSGRVNEIIVPPGMGPGSSFTVEFAEAEQTNKYDPNNKYEENKYGSTSYASNQTTSQYTPPGVVPTTTAVPANDVLPASNGQQHDDGFVTGFNNPTFVPTSAAATATNDYSSYPSATDAQPVYNAPPSYSATTY
mmetsp:Transcript_16224/g.39647  ORF Transcript_16224/g.39647 Transcript_16224/m.39647 type:complete len:225 (-) Transcript_16224:2243-2917(-)|eukprot:CAMPEP_0113646710 /NCGR_PEP_ID=MMETSP0017_2-20120614/24690_1 /TAXON_ID=2856 /ORGANISM="Cylindrotheca closterium" /LENGTH=224 /DNA_ID=CAMNT_0000558653 /DNA_START=97 /DNA_END=771 /DNA_ORIENTATION=+ /assembly_acc=CAM_ASM_000147